MLVNIKKTYKVGETYRGKYFSRKNNITRRKNRLLGIQALFKPETETSKHFCHNGCCYCYTKDYYCFMEGVELYYI